MKKAMSFLLVMLNLSIYAQDFEPTQAKFFIDGDSVLINSDLPMFKQNKNK